MRHRAGGGGRRLSRPTTASRAGSLHPFGRVAEILNQLERSHLTVEQATVSEHGIRTAPCRAVGKRVGSRRSWSWSRPMPGRSADAPTCESRSVRSWPSSASRPCASRARSIVAMGSRPVDGLLHLPELFIPDDRCDRRLAALSRSWRARRPAGASAATGARPPGGGRGEPGRAPGRRARRADR